METATYTKLSAQVDRVITIDKIGEHSYKRWNPQTSKMEVSPDPAKGFRKMYPVDTDKGKLDMSAGQVGTLLEAAQYAGKSDIIGKSFKVNSNGQVGIEIRYFFNLVTSKPKDTIVEDTGEPLDIPEDWA